MRLAGPRRPVEQQSALEVLADAKQRISVGRNPERVALHSRQNGLRKNHVVTSCCGNIAELERDPHLGRDDVEDLPSIDVQLAAQIGKANVNGLRLVHRQARDLELQARIVLAGPVDHHDVLATLIGHEHHRPQQTCQCRTRRIRQVDQWRC